jgi:carbon storage regulator
MLVLSRKQGEQIVIGNDILVTVVECSGNRIKVGIEAPRWVRVVRSEIEGDRRGDRVGLRLPVRANADQTGGLLSEATCVTVTRPR